MRIRLSVWVGSAGTSARDVVITAPEDCAREELRCDRLTARLSDALGVPGDVLCVRGRALGSGVLLGHPPLLDGVSVHLVERARWSPPRTMSPVAATELAVIGGPDAGLTRALTAGSHTVGRWGADLTVADPALSRRHLRLDVGPAGVRATDLGSENGTVVDDAACSGAATPVGVGAVLRLGHTTLTVRPSRVLPATTTPRGDGTLLVGRSPQPLPEPPAVLIEVPPRPVPPPPRRVPWPAALIPLPIAGVLAWLFGPHLLLLAVMSPLMLMGTYVSDRMGARKTAALARRLHEAERQACECRRDDALAAERTWRERTYPDLAAIVRAATTPGRLLWSRTAGDSLTVRLGHATIESCVTWAEGRSAHRARLRAAPVTLDLSAYAALAVSGPLAERVVDSILGQICVLHSPRDVAVWTDRRSWRLTPHARVARPSELMADAVATLRRRADSPDRRPDARAEPAILLAIDATSLLDDDVECLTALLSTGPGSGIHVLLSGDSTSAIGIHLETSHAGLGVLNRGHHDPLPLAVDGASTEWADRVAAGLAPLRDIAGQADDLPARVSLVDAIAGSGVETSPEGIAHHWSRSDDGAWATLGVSQAGAYHLDLATAGPHALIAGTTGSGKSELLRTLVASLAANHPPEDVSVVLIDYKGGSAFSGLETLPHIVGVVTDLDCALTERALTSLRAEIHRRESLFAGSGASDILGYRERSRRRGSGLPHLGRLVIVVDEFRALADELPDFVTGLVRLAAVGRSLGIHLVLATQRPAGVVTADMRANLGMRIALRVRDRTDSQDVIESDAAAGLPRSIPGRALIRCGSEPLESFHTATVGPPEGATGLTIEISWSDGTSTTRHYPLTEPVAPTDLVRVIATAAERGSHRAPPPPWLPPLPDLLTWREAFSPAAWAVRDDPAGQRQDEVCVDLPAMPHTAIAGAVGSGRTTTLLTLVSAALAAQGESTHLFVIADPAGALGALAAVPHTGALVDRTDAAQVADLVDRLVAEVRTRPGAPTDTRVLLVVDGWDVLADACDPLDHGALTDRLLATLREGYAVGLRAIVSGDRSVLTGRVGRTLSARILLRPADGVELALVGLPPAAVPSHWPPGRAVRVSDGAELQVLLRRPDHSSARPPTSPPRRMTRLPAHLGLGSLPAAPEGALALGLCSESADPVCVGQPGRRRVLVVGSAGAGRTSTLALIGVQAAQAKRRVCVVGEPHASLLDGLRHAQVCVEELDWDAHADLVALRRAHPDLVLLADDVDRHAESPLVPVLSQIADLAERDGGLIAVAGDGAALAMRARGIGSAVARARFGVVLGMPTPLDGDLLGLRLPRVREVIPGRGWIVADRRAVPIQVAKTSALATEPGGPRPAQRDPSTPRRPR